MPSGGIRPHRRWGERHAIRRGIALPRDSHRNGISTTCRGARLPACRQAASRDSESRPTTHHTTLLSNSKEKSRAPGQERTTPFGMPMLARVARVPPGSSLSATSRVACRWDVWPGRGLVEVESETRSRVKDPRSCAFSFTLSWPDRAYRISGILLDCAASSPAAARSWRSAPGGTLTRRRPRAPTESPA